MLLFLLKHLLLMTSHDGIKPSIPKELFDSMILPIIIFDKSLASFLPPKSDVNVDITLTSIKASDWNVSFDLEGDEVCEPKIINGYSAPFGAISSYTPIVLPL